MKIAILGTGNLGRAIALNALRGAHSVVFRARDPESLSVQKAMSVCDGATVTAMTQALDDADLVFLALPWEAARTTVTALESRLAGKTVVDCTNAYDVSEGFVKAAAFPSAVEVLGALAPRVHWVKAFNQLGAAKLANPGFSGAAPWMAGDDATAVERVVALAESFGFDAVPFGKLGAGLLLEDMARVWIHAAYFAGLGPEIGFALLPNRLPRQGAILAGAQGAPNESAH